MLHVNEICSLTDFQRNAKKHLQRLKRSRRPQVLTVNGRAAVVVQDAKAYQELLDRIERARAIEGIQGGFESIKRAEGQPAADTLQITRREHDIPTS